MFVTIDITEPIPPGVGVSYGDLKFGKYGIFAFEYHNGYLGPHYFINLRKTVLVPEYDGAVGAQWFFRDNVNSVIMFWKNDWSSVPSVFINGVETNLVQGKGLPIAP